MENIDTKDCGKCPYRGKGCTICDNMTLEIEQMQAFLEEAPPDDANLLVSRLTTINALMARSGKMLADAKLLQDTLTEMVFADEEVVEKLCRLSATLGMKLVQSSTARANHLVNSLDRQNRAFVHQSDNLRTQISFAKQDLSLQRKGY